jgi:diguanylate cyclase (GGDEF)-like protein/PAS domain S-box-containing protein
MNFPSIRPEVLGRLLVISSMLDVLSGIGAIAQFLQSALREVPGIRDLSIDVEGVIYPANLVDAPPQVSLSALNVAPCFPSPQADSFTTCRSIRMSTTHQHYGDLILVIDDPDEFILYEPYVRNIANIVATVLENRAFMHDLQTTNNRLTEVLNHLEQRVQERTSLLSAEIARREVLETALRTSEEKYRNLLATTSEGFWLLDAEMNLSEVNQALCTMLGYTQTELLSKSLVDLVDEADRSIFTEQMAQISVTDHHHYELVLLTNLGNKLHTSVHATTLWNDWGEVKGAFAFITDITERKRAEEKLQLSATVFSHAREGIFITDVQGTILDVNDAFTQITGYSRQEAIGQNPRILKSGRQSPEFYAGMWQALLGEGNWCGEIWNRRKNGEGFAALLTLSTVRDGQGKPQYFVALFSNITALKEHQQHMEYLAHYDGLTQLPNRMLLEDRLHQAMAQVERLGQKLALVYLDLDGFKAINDTYGHEAGDQLLVTVAHRMKQSLREGDTIARLGGDEFVAVLLNCNQGKASDASMQRLLAAVSKPVQVNEWVMQVSASLGVTFYPQAHSVDAEQLLNQADLAMYQAKKTGKNRYHIFKQDDLLDTIEAELAPNIIRPNPEPKTTQAR